MARHTLSVLVENTPGVLARVAGLFARRAFNIHSLAVGPTEHETISRMTVVVGPNCSARSATTRDVAVAVVASTGVPDSSSSSRRAMRW